MRDLIKNLFLKYNFKLNDEQVFQFEKYFDFLIEENKKFNLTAITEPKDVVIKHFIDSVFPANKIKENAKVIDVGSGAGFPGIPLKILRPDLKITLIDSLQKRVKFLNELIEKLSLENIEALHYRAEDYAQTKRESFDVAISRAVASIPTLAEYLIPFVKKGGFIFMYKGTKINEEIELGNNAIQVLGGKVKTVLEYKVEEIESSRFVLVIEKIKNTNKTYPRGKNLPKNKPIL